MGVVYEAVDTKLDRKVALKFLPPGLAGDPESKHRFINEARAASSLEHGSICSIYEIDETEDGQLFLVMPCYVGETLRERLTRGPLPINAAIQIILQLSRGLALAHQKGLVHRDIKPGNIFLTDGGEVRLLDFGLAKLAGATRITHPGTTMGTPGYLSPEQARGQEATASADVWALGIVFQEMLTGQAVFSGDHPQAVIYAIQNQDPKPIRQLLPASSSALQDLINRCIQKDPGNRFENAGQLVAALEGLGSSGRSQPGVRRFLIPVTLLLLAMVILAIWQPLKNRTPGMADDSSTPRINWILVADFDGPEDDPGLAEATRELISACLEQSELVVPISRDAIVRGLNMAGLSDSTVVSGQIARQLAHRAGAGTYVTGQVERLPGGYAFVVRVRDTENDNLIISLQDRASGDPEFIPVLDRVGNQLRRQLGEKPEAVMASHPALEVITPSYDAYRTLLRATALQKAGDNYSALLEARKALKFDPDFASAWNLMAACYGNTGQKDSLRFALENALTRRGRLTEPQIRFNEVLFRGFVNHDLEGALVPAKLLVGLEPSPKNHNLVGMIHQILGDWESAAREYSIAAEVSPFEPSYAILTNLTGALINLGRQMEAELLFGGLPSHWQLHRQLDLLLSQGNWKSTKEFAIQCCANPEDDGSVWLMASITLASLNVLEGEIKTALPQFQECLDQSFGRFTSSFEFVKDQLFLAAGRPQYLRPGPVLPDTTFSGLIVAGLRAVSLENLDQATEILKTARAFPLSEQNQFATDLLYLEATLAGEQKDWAMVLQLLEPFTHQGRLPFIVGRLPIRRLVAEAHENLGNLEKAATAYAAVLDPTLVSEVGANLELPFRGIEYPFALFHYAGLLDQLGKKTEARKYYSEFLDLFQNPDPEFAHLVTLVQKSLDRLDGKIPTP